jgi:hypothetical protein
MSSSSSLLFVIAPPPLYCYVLLPKRPLRLPEGLFAPQARAHH